MQISDQSVSNAWMLAPDAPLNVEGNAWSIDGYLIEKATKCYDEDMVAFKDDGGNIWWLDQISHWTQNLAQRARPITDIHHS